MLWVGAALLGGVLLRPQIEQLLPHVAALGGAAIAGLLLLLLCYIAYKWWQRWRFYKALNMARISVDELYRYMKSGTAPVVLDVRSATAQGLELRRIPGALHVPVAQVGEHMWQAAARPGHHPLLHLPERGLRRAGGSAAHEPRLPARAPAARRPRGMDRRRLRGGGSGRARPGRRRRRRPWRRIAVLGPLVGLQAVHVQLAGLAGGAVCPALVVTARADIHLAVGDRGHGELDGIAGRIAADARAAPQLRAERGRRVGIQLRRAAGTGLRRAVVMTVDAQTMPLLPCRWPRPRRSRPGNPKLLPDCMASVVLNLRLAGSNV